MGSWLSYGLGNGTDTLPTMSLLADDRGGPNAGPRTGAADFCRGNIREWFSAGGERAVRDLYAAQKNAAKMMRP